MSYCLNPNCVQPENPQQSNFCRSCGSMLRLRDRYLAIKPIGQGGFGRTFKAIDEDKPSKPFCAIKQFFPQIEGTTAAQKAAELFTQEASALEQLDYPNIPKLLAYFITPDGRQYLVQEFVDGQNLKDELAEHDKFSAVQIRELLTTILSTLEYIHQLGFIHRDIKPENIIRRTDNRQLYLVDFGAAKLAALDRPQLPGTTIGTPEFMAPEQGWGRSFPSSDLYSLGVTCLNLLTGISPFNLFDDNLGTWIWQDSLTTPIDPQLTTIINKLIEPKPIDRYQTVRAVIDALQVTNPIINPPQSNIYSPIVTLPSPIISPQPSNIALAPISTPALKPNPIYNWQEDYISVWHNKPINTIDISANGQYLVSGDDGGTVAVWNLTMPQQPIGTYCNNNAIYGLAISPDCIYIASGGKNRRVQLRRRESLHNSLRELTEDAGIIYSVKFSSDGQILASGGADRRIRLWNPHTGKIISTLNEQPESVMAMQFMPNGKILVSAGADRSIQFWDVENKQLLKTIQSHDQSINALVISQDGQLIISGSSDRTVQIRQLGTSNPHILTGHQDGVQAVAISPDGKTIASGSIDGMVHLWDTDTKALTHSFQAHQGAVKSIVFQINSKFLITASLDRTIKIWRATK
ncbi:MAG: serine/threonine protein kinase [Chamaesiphon sp.]|nr:serine/threonine protein kinase [Chamaesiphon sp.]